MSGISPFFISGATAKIKVNGKTLAFCTDLSYTIDVIHKTPKVLGMYEGTSVEPLGYSVTGSFTILRYVKNASKVLNGHIPHGIKTDGNAGNAAEGDAGNGIGNMGNRWSKDNALTPSLMDGRPEESFDPSKLSKAPTFDLQVYQKIVIPNKVTSGPDWQKKDLFELGIVNLRDVRLVRSEFSINKRSAGIQRFSFVALYADEDSFTADYSGTEQKFN